MSRSVSSNSVLLIAVVIAGGVLIAVIATRKEPAAANANSNSNVQAQVSASPAGAAATPAKPPPAPAVAAANTACERCTTQNCVPTTDACERMTDTGDRKLCEDLYACFTNPAYKCVVQGDPLPCWCGKQMTTCVTANEPPLQADGPCAERVFAAAKTRDAPTIRKHFLDANLPLGRAVNLTSCRGSFCSAECGVP